MKFTWVVRTQYTEISMLTLNVLRPDSTGPSLQSATKPNSSWDGHPARATLRDTDDDGRSRSKAQTNRGEILTEVSFSRCDVKGVVG